MTSINTNVGALNARAAAVTATSRMERAMERLSSGLRINSALMTRLASLWPARWSLSYAALICPFVTLKMASA